MIKLVKGVSSNFIFNYNFCHKGNYGLKLILIEKLGVIHNNFFAKLMRNFWTLGVIFAINKTSDK